MSQTKIPYDVGYAEAICLRCRQRILEGIPERRKPPDPPNEPLIDFGDFPLVEIKKIRNRKKIVDT